MEKIAFIGLGAMGGPLACNISRKQIPITVYDIAADRIGLVTELGATAAGAVAEAARGKDVVFTCLPATQHVLEVVCGPGGVLEQLEPGALLVEMSTISPQNGTDIVKAACAAKGVRFMDAPIGRLVMHAIQGKSMFMVGCDDDADLARVQHVFDAMGDTIVRCGKSGTGIRAKLVNNYQVLSIAQITAEALVLATKLGVDLDVVKSINAQTSATNGQMQINFANKALLGDTEPGFTCDLSHKDMTLALDAAAQARLGLPVGAAVHAVYGATRSTKYAALDFTALVDYAAELAGIDPPRLPGAKA